jgi:hypothetical protein
MSAKSFKNVDYIDCKIIVFEMNKRVFLHPSKKGRDVLQPPLCWVSMWVVLQNVVGKSWELVLAG